MNSQGRINIILLKVMFFGKHFQSLHMYFRSQWPIHSAKSSFVAELFLIHFCQKRNGCLIKLSDLPTISQLKVAMMYRKSKLIDSGKRFMIARDARWRVGKMGEEGQKVQTFSYKLNKSWGYDLQHDDYS